MKRIFSTTFNQNSMDWAILFLRICIACFMLTHGMTKFWKLVGDDPIKFADPLGVGIMPSLVLTVFSEVFCSILLFVGFATRLACIPLIITMFVAVFVVHWTDGFGKMEFALLYLLIYIMILVVGAGRFSLDRVLENKLMSKN